MLVKTPHLQRYHSSHGNKLKFYRFLSSKIKGATLGRGIGKNANTFTVSITTKKIKDILEMIELFKINKKVFPKILSNFIINEQIFPKGSPTRKL